MNKHLVEIFKLYGKYDVSKKYDNFVINSLDELDEALLSIGFESIYADGGKQDYEALKKGKIKSAIFPHYGDWDEPKGYELLVTSYKDRLEQIEKEYKNKKEELNQRFGI